MSMFCFVFFDRYLSALLHVTLILIYQQHVWSPWQPWSLQTDEEEQPCAEVARQPQGKLHLEGPSTFTDDEYEEQVRRKPKQDVI